MQLDPEVLRRAQAGEAAAQTPYLRRCAGPMRALVRRLGQRGEQDDQLQELLFTLLRALPRFSLEGPATLSTWTFAVAHRFLLAQRRKRRLELVPLDDATDVSDPALLELAAGEASISGAPIPPRSSVLIHEGQSISSGPDAALRIRDARGSVLLAQASARYAAAPSISLGSGMAVIEGARTLESRGVTFKIDGLAIVSAEPLDALEQATLATSITNEGEPMHAALNLWKRNHLSLAAGATVALWMAQGSAQAMVPGEPAIAVAAGGVWSNASRSAALVADARNPAAAARTSPAAATTASAERFDNLTRAEVISAIAHSGGLLGLCFRKGMSFGSEAVPGAPVANPPDWISFVLSLEVTTENGESIVENAVLSGISPAVELAVSDCLKSLIRTVRFPRPHPGARASVRIAMTLAPREDGNLDATLGEEEEPHIIDVHRAEEKLAARPVDQARMVRTLDESGDPTMGPAQAPITIIEFTDFQCSFCKKVNDTLLTLQKLYGDKVRFVFKQNPLPFHAQAALAAEAALAANAQGKFAPYRELLYYGGGESLTRPQLEAYAQQLGLDMERFRGDLDANRYAAQIAADQAQAKTLNAKGVPTFFINDQVIQGAQPVEKFVEVIDALLAAQ